jgi:flagellar protein FliO/FliZ
MGDRMATLGSLLINAAIFIGALGVAAAAGFYLYEKAYPGKVASLFAARPRPRLAYIERTALEGGRKLLLVRRDDVEHLILIGGPIDLVVETGIKLEGLAAASKSESYAKPIPSDFGSAERWNGQAPSVSEAKSPGPIEPRLSLSPKTAAAENKPLELTVLHEAKAAE